MEKLSVLLRTSSSSSCYVSSQWSVSDHHDDSGVIDLTGKIMLVTIIFLFFMLIFVFCLHLYARWYWSHQQAITTATAAQSRRRRRRRLDFAAGHYEVTLESASRRRGLHPAVLKTIPVVTIDPDKSKDELECAVCLCEVSEGEKARLLPKCNHWFHVECIDMWFQSHSTCPLCRNAVSSNPKQESCISTVTECTPDMEQQGHHREGGGVEEPSSSSSMASTTDGAIDEVAIEIPQQMDEEEDEEQKSTLSTRFESLKRLLSGGNSTRVNPSSPRNLDQEQV